MAEVVGFVPTVRIMKYYAPPVEALYCYLVRNKQHRFLVRGIRTIAPVDTSYKVVGPITHVRYALNSLKIQATIFPMRVVSDYGGVYTGMNAIDWIIKKGLSYPRSDVDCVMSDGTIISCMLRDLNLSVVPVVHVGADSDKLPGKHVSAIISINGSIDSDIYSSRVRHCLPIAHISEGEDIVESAMRQVQALG
ncbi:MAG: hypothetical protein QF704_06405 [Anaerolineales bacterium]|nr:hypothetical protein [Anaerolineales bacterium]